MKRTVMAKFLLVFSLALMLPFEQALCAPAGVAGRSGSCAMHACCRTHSACPLSHTGHATRACECRIAPAATLPALGAPSAPSTSCDLYAAVLGRPAAPPNSNGCGIVAPADVGGPPLPAAFGAHRLRAPPVSA